MKRDASDFTVGAIIGDHNQIEILSSQRSEAQADVIEVLLFCSTCAKDTGLYGDGIFKTRLESLRNGGLPCGCSKIPRFKSWQHKLRVERICEARGYTLASTVPRCPSRDAPKGWGDSTTRLQLKCNKHSTLWWSNVAKLVGGDTCRACLAEDVGTPLQSDEEILEKHIEEYLPKFLETGKFHEGTLFCATGKTSYVTNWLIKCPGCARHGFNTSLDGEFYVLKVSGPVGDFTGYGISNFFGSRLKVHKRKLAEFGFCIEDMEVFPMAGTQAWKLEREIIKTFPCRPQEVSGFRREATHCHHYLDVIAHAEEFIQRIAEKSENTC